MRDMAITEEASDSHPSSDSDSEDEGISVPRLSVAKLNPALELNSSKQNVALKNHRREAAAARASPAHGNLYTLAVRNSICLLSTLSLCLPHFV
jgi:hypothetical protein